MIELKRPQRWLEPPWGMSQDWSLTMHNSKTCTSCGQILDLANFSPNPAGRNGYRSACKPCRAAYTQQWSDSNKERKAETDRRYRIANKDKRALKDKAWRDANKDRIRQNQLAWSKANPERVKKTKQKWEQANPEARRQKLLRYRAKLASNEVRTILPKEMRALYLQSCFFCASNNQIEADHIIPLARGGRHAIGNLLPLCRNCNASKSNKTIMEYRMWLKRTKPSC